MRQFECPYCGEPINLTFRQCVPNHIFLSDVTCDCCKKDSFFPILTKLFSYLLGAVAMLFVIGIYAAFIPFTTYGRVAFGLMFGGFAYAWVAAAICYRSSTLYESFWSARRTT
jgi:hypothetical protein